mgnify:CR=1 FL=1
MEEYVENVKKPWRKIKEIWRNIGKMSVKYEGICGNEFRTLHPYRVWSFKEKFWSSSLYSPWGLEKFWEKSRDTTWKTWNMIFYFLAWLRNFFFKTGAEDEGICLKNGVEDEEICSRNGGWGRRGISKSQSLYRGWSSEFFLFLFCLCILELFSRTFKNFMAKSMFKFFNFNHN